MAHNGELNIFLTSVTYEELKWRIKKESQELDQFIKNFLRGLSTKHKIVKNLGDIESLYSFPYSMEDEDFLSKFSQFLEFAKVTIVGPKKDFEIDEILTRYFQQSPPFAKKKNEFPDAISLKIIQDFCRDNKVNITLLTQDSDFNEVKEEFIKVVRSIEEILKELAPADETEEALALKYLKNNKELFLPNLRTELELDILVYFQFTLFNERIKLNLEDIVIDKTIVSDFDIFVLESSFIGFKCIGNFLGKVTNWELTELITQEELEEVFHKNKFHLSQEGVSLKGQFETTFYYYFEYPYFPLQHTLEISEDTAITVLEPN